MSTDHQPRSNLRRMTIRRGPFRGAAVLLNIGNAKRKILGVYEYTLNPWVAKYTDESDVLIDLGASDGYFTYGFAHRKNKNQQKHAVIAVEPAPTASLTTPKDWSTYKESEICIVEKCVGAQSDDGSVTLDALVGDELRKILVKMDIEGAEIETLQGAPRAVANNNIQWIIEIHGKERIPQVAKHFVDANRPFLILDLPPLPVIGAELRSIYTSWLVTL